ncbi:MAG: DUF5680 domain-containing protein [Nanoarchaeota archaeon]
MKIGKLEISLEELQHFIVKAKRNGYAGGTEKQREKDGSKTYTFQEGNFHYTDNYAGSNQAPGTEIVKWQREDEQRIWQMSYSGGMLPEFWENEKLSEQTFKFLKEVLMQVTFNHPFRGPQSYEGDDFFYFSGVQGNIKRFKGNEEIFSRSLDKTVFSQDFIGGLVIPKIK